MERRLNRDDLFGSNPLVTSEAAQHSFVWFVYDSYELVKQDGVEPYLQATTVPKDTYEFHEALKANVARQNRLYRSMGKTAPVTKEYEIEPFGRWYEPLLKTPYLFLEFARLYEHKNTEQAILWWTNQYGLLGLQERDHHRYDIDMGGGPGLVAFSKDHSQIGGKQETLSKLLSEARRANRILVSFEAILSKDVKTLEQLAFKDLEELGLTSSEMEVYVQEIEEHLHLAAALSGETYADALVDWVLSTYILENVQEMLKQYTFPSIAHRASIKPEARETLWAPDRLIRSFHPRNLLGAMYIQFYWLLTSAAELSHCKQCGRIIPYVAPPITSNGKTRKPRKDKEFCDDRCRQNYHYQNRVKPRRNPRRNGGKA